MKKQILAIILTLCLVVSMLPANALAVSDFSDMPNDYSTEALRNAVKNGLLRGSGGKIMANGNLTRAQMAAVLVRAFGADKAADLTGFTDVTPDAWYYTELSSAVYMGLFHGDGATMRPNAPITRQEAFVVLARAFDLKTENTSILDQFSDKASIGEWAKDGVAAMIASGFVKGDGENLNPLSNLSRKQFAVVMDRMVKTYIKESGTVTTLPDGSVVINKPNATLKDVTVKGNLIIGDGVGEGCVTLDNVNVEGDIIVRGGGTFVVKGKSSLGTVNISKVDGNVRIAAEVSAEVKVIAIKNGKNDVVIEGKADKLETYSATPVRLRNAIIKEVSVATPNAKVIVGEGTKVDSVTVSETANVTSLEVSKGATVTTVNVAGESIRIDGEGRVEKVNVTGNNVIVNTEGTKVTAAENVSGVIAGGIEVKPHQTVTTPVKNPSTGGSSSGGSSPIKYTVTFNSNGGTKVTSQTVIPGHKATEPKAPKKEYSLFKGWYADAEYNTPFNFDTAIVANTTVYAKWMTKEECQQAVNDHFANSLNLAGLTVDKVYNLSPEFNANTTSYTASTKDGVFKFKPNIEVGKSEINIEGLGTYQVKTDIMVSLDENSDGISGNLADGYTIKKAEGTEDKKLTITTKAEVFVNDYGNLGYGYTFVANKVYTITLKTSAPYIVTDLTLVDKNNLVFRVRKSDGKYIQSSELFNESLGGGPYQVKLPMGASGRPEAKKTDQKTDNDGTWLYINYYDWKDDTFKTVDKVIIEEGTVSKGEGKYYFNVTKSYELMQGQTWNTLRVTGISLDFENLVLALGEKAGWDVQPAKKIKPDLAKNKTVTLSYSNPEIITADTSYPYYPKAVGIGEAALIYTTQDGGHTAQCNVKVVHYIIDPAKQQNGDGTSKKPFATIQAALDKAKEQSINNPVIYFVNHSYSVAEGDTITIPEGVTLTIPEGVTITVNGTIDGAGSLAVKGGINGNGNWLGKGTN